MTSSFHKFGAAACLAAVAMTTAAHAHGAWVAERHGAFYVVYGHGAADDAYDPAKVTSVQGCTIDMACTDIAVNRSETHLSFEKPAEEMALIRMEFDNGYWTKDAAGAWLTVSKDQVPGAVESGRYLKTGTFVADHLTTVPAAFGTGLEIRPLADPLSLKRGDMLEVEVLLDGTPAAGAELIADYVNDGDAAPIVAGADGKATVPVASGGLNVMVAFFTTPPDDPALADEVGHAASLAFALEHGPE